MFLALRNRHHRLSSLNPNSPFLLLHSSILSPHNSISLSDISISTIPNPRHYSAPSIPATRDSGGPSKKILKVMANQEAGMFISEDSLYNRPPFFDGTDYYYWKERMRIFIQAYDLDMWNIVENGPYVPSITTDAGTIEAKPRTDWTNDETQKYQLNCRATWFLICALSKSEYNMVACCITTKDKDKAASCITAKEIWDTLMIIHEGTNQVKRSRISLLQEQYDLFEMGKDESIEEMFNRFAIIVNKMRSLGEIYSNEEQVDKILRSLSKVWLPKVFAIQEAKDLSTLELSELLGILKAYEQRMKMRNQLQNMRRN